MNKNSGCNIKIRKIDSKKKETASDQFDYQMEAINNLKLLDDKFPNYYSTLVVVPTGGGKTRIAVEYLYRNVLNQKGHKVLWIAERLLLLEQAYSTFENLADTERLNGKEESEVVTRLISSQHGNYVASFHAGVDLVIITQQTLEKKIDRKSEMVEAMEEWLTAEDCLTIVIDEAHHAVAEPYKAILLSLLKLRKIGQFKSCHIIGLTATPKSQENDKRDEIEEIFSFGIMNDEKKGVIATSKTSYGYQISIHDLVRREVLSVPYMAQVEDYADKDEAILQTYKDGISSLNFYDGQTGEHETSDLKEIPESFGQTIVFADSRIHALKLEKMFENMNIKCGLAISLDKKFEDNFAEKEGSLEAYCGKTVAEKRKEMKEDIQNYKDGNLTLIITVELLLEGVDIPKTQTVFIAKEEPDDVDITQMVGRALRGKFQKGTPTAFIISFGKDKLEKILWETPDSYNKDAKGKEISGEMKLSELYNIVSQNPDEILEEEFREGEISQEKIEWLLQFEKGAENTEEQSKTAVMENLLIRNTILKRISMLPQGYYLFGKKALLVWEGMQTWIEVILQSIDQYGVDTEYLRSRSDFHIKAKEIIGNIPVLSDEEKVFLTKDTKEVYLFHFMRFYVFCCGLCKETFEKEIKFHEFAYLRQYDVSGILVQSIGKNPDKFDAFISEMWHRDEANLQKAWHDEETFCCFLKPKLQRFHDIKIEPTTEEEDEDDYFRVRLYREGRKRPALCEMLKQIVGSTAESCSCFVDVFGGTGTVTAQMSGKFSKRIYNDFDVNLANFIYCISDEIIGKEFAKFCYDQIGKVFDYNINELIIQGKSAIEKNLNDNGLNDKDILNVLQLKKIEEVLKSKIDNLTKNAEEKKKNKRKEYNEKIKSIEKDLPVEQQRILMHQRSYLLGRYRQLTKEKKMLEDTEVKEKVKRYIAFYYLTNLETAKLSSDDKIRQSLNSHDILDYNELKNRAFRFLFSRGFSSYQISGESVTGVDSTGIGKFNEHLNWKNGTSWITAFHDRMKEVEVHCRDFREILKDYATEDTVFYLDPPYFLTCQYAAGFSDEFHLDMLEWLRTTESKWVLSCKDTGTNQLEAVNWKCRIGRKKKIIYVEDLKAEHPKLDEYFKGFLYPMMPMEESDADAYWENARIQKKKETVIYKADAKISEKRQDKLWVYSLADEKYGEIMVSNIEVKVADRKILMDRGIKMENFEIYFKEIFKKVI